MNLRRVVPRALAAHGETYNANSDWVAHPNVFHRKELVNHSKGRLWASIGIE